MTREMNKPDWHYKYIVNHKIAAGTIFEKKSRVLGDWIKPFVDSVNERFKQCGKQ